MSDAAFADEGLDEGQEDDLELDGQEAEGDEEEGEEEVEPKPKDWQKIAHDKEGALAKERSKRRAETARARDLEERLEKLERSKGGASEDDITKLIASIRDDDDDPIGDLAGIKQVLRKFMSERDAEKAMDTEAQQQQRQVNKIANAMSEAEDDFRDDHPDYDDAQKFYKEHRKGELEEMGYTGQALSRKLTADLFSLVSDAMQAGRDPAQAVYNLAKKRGFGVDGVAKKIQTLQRGQLAGRSIPTGGKPTQELTAGSVAKLKGAAFDAAFEKLKAQAKRAS
jgi:hypothetical protein